MSNSTPRILLVDDEPVNLFLLEEVLQLQGYETISALSGAEALRLAKACEPALILLDVMMPEMDGFEVCRQCREDPQLQTVPVIFLTALDDDESRLKAIEMMGDDYITKPIQTKFLIAKISSIFRLQAMRNEKYKAQVTEKIQEKNQKSLSAAWQINQALTEKFRLFVPEQFLQRIAPRGVESIELGNANEEEMTILFCDIRGFTSMAEEMPAMETFKWLNSFFTQMNEVICSNYGFIDKFLGDAILAVFDRPNHHAEDAVTAAVMMRQTLQDFNASHDAVACEGPVNIGIGVHTGRGLIGTLGADSRMDSTVIGDVVNTASRLQDLTKVYGCQVIVSQATISELNNPNSYYYRFIDQVTPRGKQKSLFLYELLGSALLPLDEAKITNLPIYELGLEAWQNGKPEIAISYFAEIVKQNSADSLAVFYLKRCQEEPIRDTLKVG
ncbi:response regulator [Ancylothrix sp. C2]|uniref:response regulator n=1 Tax=Ancylothrix sp. D3o TaxID=2953691 RepID=UPI0021BBA0C8|nr:adenylate/guanylate cyclase domain-containing protein [Ancylothrix sp. D3o]MCT7950507.1 response regulator [Ancylothrix sp. D3o]